MRDISTVKNQDTNISMDRNETIGASHHIK